MKALFVYPLASIAVSFVLSSAEGETQECSRFNKWITFSSKPYCKTAASVEDQVKNMLHHLGLVNSPESVKQNKWNTWLKKKKISLTEKLETESQQYMENLENDWDEFMISLENKWRHYNPHMEDEYACSVYPLGLKWDKSKWTLWFYKKGLECLKNDFKKWITECKKGYNTHMKNVVQEFDKQYYDDWCSRSEKYREDYYCKRWKKRGLHNDQHDSLKLEQCQNWNESNENEKDVWTTLMKDALKYYAGPDFNLWIEFRKEKIYFYKQWMQAFAEQWTQVSQWNTWTAERKDYIKKHKDEQAKKKAALKKAPTKKSAQNIA
ncbi:tryptophan-rich antigen [Plasmodium cynomolgi strain B]|uniref:Tryptophan-rich antigen n=1 Tax=Plasmodium cynomolgi (strain B) TaxID=1120755 RepID=K6UWH6_PLACD|nr:tryptophan-rich antigen [Plasmodium cynomolgi strain B]GAB66750.1 tryptophan-rich antigen [Plasmodium cynomolgi strain B]